MQPEKLKIAFIVAAEGDLTSLPPLGPAFLAAAIHRDLPGARALLCEKFDEVLLAKPDLVGISAGTDNYALATAWAKELKARLGVPVILGGIHISLAPRSLDPCFDLAVVGEGEAAIVEVLRSYLRRGRFDHEELEDISGLAFFLDGSLRLTPPRPQAADLTALAMPRAELAPYYRERPAARHLFTARGCPYSCDFCASSRLFPGYRALPAARVADEIERLVTAEKASRVIFYDDLLAADKRRLADLAAELERRGLTGRCRFTGSVRADLVDRETCRLLARIGFDLAAVGLESFSDGVLAFLNKKGLSGAVNQRALDLLAEHGIAALGLFMFGVPVETVADVELTLEAVRSNAEAGKLSDAYWALLAPYPGTKTWEQAAARGLVKPAMDWKLFSGGGRPELYLGERLTRAELAAIVGKWRAKLAPLRPGGPSPSRTSLFCEQGAGLHF